MENPREHGVAWSSSTVNHKMEPNPRAGEGSGNRYLPVHGGDQNKLGHFIHSKEQVPV